jgi:hypothetical protein
MANHTYHRYKKLSEGLFDPIDASSANACLSDLRGLQRMARRFEKCAVLRANYTQKYVPPEKRDAEHRTAIEAAKARAAECRKLLETLKQSIPTARSEWPPVPLAHAPNDPRRNVWEVLETEQEGVDKEDEGRREEGHMKEGHTEDGPADDGWRGDFDGGDRKPIHANGTNERDREGWERDSDDDVTIDGARLAVKLELLYSVSRDVYQACERWKLSFTNEVKYEMIHSLLLYIYGESCIHEARRKVSTFVESKSFLVSLGFFAIRDLQRGNESVMRKAARVMQRRYGDQVKAMNLKEVFMCVHCMLTLFFG